nr:reverse transcriptase domain-containing protein [Tanacetum cinerariifolium]
NSIVQHASESKIDGGKGHPPWWGMDVLGPLLKASGKVRIVIMAVDYFTKWIEAKPLSKTTGKEVKKFVWDNIVCMYGLPKIIVSDNGTNFIHDPFKSCLTFESEAVIPTEFGMPTHQTMMIKEGKGNEEEIRLNFDLLQERREAAAIREARYKMKIEHYYNKRVRPMSFKVGEYVYRKNKANRVENLGKLGPKWEGPYLVVEAYQNGLYKLRTMDDKEVPRVWQAINLRRCYL